MAGLSEGQGKPGMFRKIRHHRAREEGVAELCVPLPLAHCTIVTFLTLGPCNLGWTAETGDPKWSSKGCED